MRRWQAQTCIIFQRTHSLYRLERARNIREDSFYELRRLQTKVSILVNATDSAVAASVCACSRLRSISSISRCRFAVNARFDVPGFVARYKGASENAIKANSSKSSSNATKNGTKRTPPSKTSAAKQSKKAKAAKSAK